MQSIFSGLLILFILLVFQPFGTYNWQHPYRVLILAGYGLVAVIVNLLDFFVSQNLSKSYFAERGWTILKEVLRNIAGLVVTGFLCVVYGYFVGLMPFSIPQITYMITICFMVGAFPAAILILLNYTYLTQKYSLPVLPTSQPQTTLVPNEAILNLVAENEKDSLSIPAINLLYIAASDNYCTVFYTVEDKLHKTLLRSSLSRLASQVNSSGIVRCHRSYLVNLGRVKSVSGNAQGYKLYFDAATEPVPVSRSYTSLLKEQALVC